MENGALMEVAARLERAESPIHDQNAIRGLVALEESVGRAEAAWSGSWLGYHSRVYYKGLNPPPSSARFSHEWGLLEGDGSGGRVSTGDWRKGRVEDVIAIIWKNAGHPNINAIRQESVVAAQIFEAAKHEILSHLKSLLAGRPDDDALSRLAGKIKQSSIVGSQGFIEKWMPAELPFSRDSFAVGEGVQVPPHITVKAEVWAIRQPFMACGELAKSVRRLSSKLSHPGGEEMARVPSAIPRVITVHPQPPGRPRKGGDGEGSGQSPNQAAFSTLSPPRDQPSLVQLVAERTPDQPAPPPVPETSSQPSAPDIGEVESDVPANSPVAGASPAVARPIGMRAPPPSAQDSEGAVPASAQRMVSPMSVPRATAMRPPDMAAQAPAPDGGDGQTGVCLCHGRSNGWKDLREVLRKELPRDYHEFNMVPMAGASGRAKLDELCRTCALAILVLTEEDIRLEEQRHVETYAIHAAGIFQGRLGYGRAVLLIEEGCEGLSHLQDVPQITYTRGDIKGVLGEIKSILEREGLLR